MARKTAVSATKAMEPAKTQAKALAPAPAPVPAVRSKRKKTDVISAAAYECREKIQKSLQNIESDFCDLAEALHSADQNRYFAEWGHNSFEEFAEKELEMGYRKARYLVEIHDTILKVGLSRDQVIRVGWTKMRELSGPLKEDPKGAKKLLAEAEKKTVKELMDSIRIRKGVKARSEVLRISVKFDASAGKIITDAVNLANGEIGEENLPKALAHICGEYLMLKGGGAQVSTLEDWIAYINKSFGVILVVSEGEDELGVDAEAAGSVDDDVSKLLGIED
jgi:hypothetical protein